MQQRNPRTIRDMTILGGWLFADLLLALVVIFMAAQPPFPRPTAQTPTPVLSPTPTIPPHLESSFTEIPINRVDYNGILHNSPSAVKAMENYINNQAALLNRKAGLVIVYDGAQTTDDIADARKVGSAVVDNVLKPMGTQGMLFSLASYYGPLYYLGKGHDYVALDIYLFAQS